MIEEFMRAYDKALGQKYGDPVRMAEFVAIHGREKVLADQEYTLARAEARVKQGQRPEADQLEAIFIDGVNIGGWLGDVTGDSDAYAATARPTASYDDFSHRLDVAVELTFRRPIASHDGRHILPRTTIGIDTTLSGTPQVVREKLTRHYSDFAQLPFGFSHLDYYAYDERREARALVPRYVIGLNVHEVRKIWRERASGNGTKAFRPDSGVSLQTRFKVLTEIRRQNLLYYAMLPEDHESETVALAALQIEAVDECLNAALSDCARQIVAERVLPEAVFARRRRGSRRRSQREVIESCLIQENRRRYANIDPFTRIVGETQHMLDVLYTPETDAALYRALDGRRKIMVQNRALRA